MVTENNIFEELKSLLLYNPVDLSSLRSYSRCKGGFQTNELRQRIWPKLLCINRYNIIDFRSCLNKVKYEDDHQVCCDVDRSLWSLMQSADWNDSLRSHRRNSLYHIILAVLIRNNGMHYYQGYHDLVSVFLLILEDDYLTFQIVERVSKWYLRDVMQKDFTIVTEILPLILSIIEPIDNELHQFITSVGIEPFFALSWLITWFSHDVKDLNKIARLFDAILCSHPSYPLYLCSAMILSVRDEVLEQEKDFAILHSFLVQVPRSHDIDVEQLILLADSLMKKTKPHKLRKKLSYKLQWEVEVGHIKMLTSKKLPTQCLPDWELLRNKTICEITPKSSEGINSFSSSSSSPLVTSWGWVPTTHMKKLSQGKTISSNTIEETETETEMEREIDQESHGPVEYVQKAIGKVVKAAKDGELLSWSVPIAIGAGIARFALL